MTSCAPGDMNCSVSTTKVALRTLAGDITLKGVCVSSEFCKGRKTTQVCEHTGVAAGVNPSRDGL